MKLQKLLEQLRKLYERETGLAADRAGARLLKLLVYLEQAGVVRIRVELRSPLESLAIARASDKGWAGRRNRSAAQAGAVLLGRRAWKQGEGGKGSDYIFAYQEEDTP